MWDCVVLERAGRVWLIPAPTGQAEQGKTTGELGAGIGQTLPAP